MSMMRTFLLLVVLFLPSPNEPVIHWWRDLGQKRITVYQLVPEQTSDDPTTFADGTTAEDNAGVSVCALSREMLARWGGPVSYGDTIYVASGPLMGFYEVHDTMAKRALIGGVWQDVRGYVDILTDTIYGAWDATVYHVRYEGEAQ
jgi:hypothetical protein